MIAPHITKANKYIADILSGKIPACLYVQQACQRQVENLKESKKKTYPYIFDNAKAEDICEFAEMMPHVKGKWAGSNMVLEPWECFLLTTVFGWLRKSDGLRRFREMYAELPRKNGKSVIGAIIGNYMFVADEENGGLNIDTNNINRYKFAFWSHKTIVFRIKVCVEVALYALTHKHLRAL